MNQAHQAQADNLAAREAIAILDRAASTLTQIANRLTLAAPGAAGRLEVRRALSGVLADVETVRLSIKA